MVPQCKESITITSRLGHSQLIFNSAFQLMNEEQEGGRLLILNFNFIGLEILRGGSFHFNFIRGLLQGLELYNSHIDYRVVPYMDSTEHRLLIIKLTNEINIHIIGPTQIFHEVVSSSLGSIQLLTQLTILIHH